MVLTKQQGQSNMVHIRQQGQSNMVHIRQVLQWQNKQQLQEELLPR